LIDCVHFICDAFVLRWSYRAAGLYWVGSIGHSMLVLVPGAILSKHIHTCTGLENGFEKT